MSSSSYQKIYQIVKNIPCGKVATYGQIADLAGFPGQARLVGYALNSLPEELDIPWHRVINSQGKISFAGGSGWYEYQMSLLETEGIEFSPSGKIDLKQFQWQAK
ncbi:MAG: methyltransferase [Candidatus Cloacimonas sp. SDB]|nr:MAG: methyltransferase [Candidatus Cloacimonas sp. SDB]